MNHQILKKIIYEQHEVIKNSLIVERDVFLEKDASYVLVGLRRAGKSTMLYKRVQDLIKEGVEWNQIIYINFDDERLLEFNVNDFEDILLVAEEMSNKKHYFYFDEIQEIDNWEYFALRIANQGLKVDITGSNAKMLSREIEGKLGGRYISKEILPYSFKEYLRANKINEEAYIPKDIANINLALEQYFVYGGFPASINFFDKREYVSNVYKKVLYGDIVSRHNIRNENSLKLLIKKLTETIGQDISYTRLQNLITGIGYKISKDVLIDYCYYCEEAFLIFNLKNYFGSFTDKNSNNKFYFRDNGIVNLFLEDKRSSLLENIVAIYLYNNYKEHLYYLKGNKVDIDFYLANKEVALQVAYSLDQNCYDREINSLIEFKKNNEKAKLIIVTYDEEKVINQNDVIINVISLKNFLLSKI